MGKKVACTIVNFEAYRRKKLGQGQHDYDPAEDVPKTQDTLRVGKMCEDLFHSAVDTMFQK